MSGKKNNGYNHKDLLSIQTKTDEVRKGYEALHNDLLTTGAAVELSQSESLVTNAGVANSGSGRIMKRIVCVNPIEIDSDTEREYWIQYVLISILRQNPARNFIGE